MSHPADLKALCLVSKHISAIPVSCLYRNIVLPYNDEDTLWTRLKTLAGSKSIQYVRTFEIGYSSFSEFVLCKSLDEFIPKLPANALTRFRYNPFAQPTHQGMQHLWKHQTNLTNLQLDFSLMAPSMTDLIKEDAATLRSLRSVSELELYFGFGPSTGMEDISELMASMELSKLKRVFLLAPAHWGLKNGKDTMIRTIKTALPTSLTSISLNYIDLSALNDFLLDEYRSLKHLELYACANPCSVLNRFRRPSLTSLTVQLCEWQVDLENITQVHDLLLRFRSLKRLVFSCSIEVSDQVIIDGFADSIANHCEDLQNLIIHFLPEDITGHSLAQIPMRCQQLSGLVMPAGESSLSEQCQVRL